MKQCSKKCQLEHELVLKTISFPVNVMCWQLFN